eukprot:m.165807 g.165807  ORF g.165807 m.165807 type:complete len:550 (-) comp12608_c0_seq1:198-1847(-)
MTEVTRPRSTSSRRGSTYVLGESETDGLLRDSESDDDDSMGGGGGGGGRNGGGVDTNRNPFDAAIDRIGFGRGQMFVLLAAAMANASDSVELAAVSFAITTTMECDLDLDAPRKGWLISSTFIGMMVGGWLWGQWADKYGRKRTLVMALALNASAALGCAMATTFLELVIYRAVCGLGIGGSIPILFSFFSEFTPAAQRGKAVTVLAASWMVGAIVVAILAFLILSPTDCDRDSSDKRTREAVCADQAMSQCGLTQMGGGEIDSWRLFLLASTVPSLLATILVGMTNESPRWLMLNGYPMEAERVLESLARSNGTMNSGWEVALRSSMNEAAQGTGADSDSEATERKQRTFIDAMVELTSPPLASRMLLLCGCWFFLSFGFYGFTLWLPSYYQSGGIDDDSDVYLVSIFVGLANLPGNMFSYLMVDRIGRKWTLILSLVLSGACVFVVLGITTTEGVVAFSCVFAAVSVSAWNALDVLVVELFPTIVRSTAFGIQAAVGRMGSISSSLIFGEFSDSNPALPMTVTGIALFAAALCCLMLPNTGRGTAIH